MALSSGQVNDTFQKALGRLPTSGELSQYTGDNTMEGTAGQQTLFSKLNPGGAQANQSSSNQQAVTDAANAAQSRFQGLADQNTKSVTDFLGNYKTDVGNAIGAANAQFKLPEQTDLVNSLNTRINDLRTNFSNTGAGGFSNAGQVDAAINSRYLPQLTTAQSNLNTSAGLAQQQEQIALSPDVANESLLANNITTAMQGLTATQSQVMQGIIANLEAGVSLTNTQLQYGEALAATVLNNANNLAVQQSRNAFTAFPQGSTIVNPRTGSITNPGILAAGGVYVP